MRDETCRNYFGIYDLTSILRNRKVAIKSLGRGKLPGTESYLLFILDKIYSTKYSVEIMNFHVEYKKNDWFFTVIIIECSKLKIYFLKANMLRIGLNIFENKRKYVTFKTILIKESFSSS